METIYVALRGEGVDVWRPVEATNEGGLAFRISDTEAPLGADWEFAPGTRVRREWRDLSGERALVAVAAP